MQPIPLDLTASNTIIIVAFSAAVAFGALGIALADRIDKREAKGLGFNPNSPLVAFIAIFVVFFGGLVFSTVEYSAERKSRSVQVQTKIEEIYGLELTLDEVRQLEYPRETPEKDFEVFGSILQREQIEGAQFEERTIYLVWADGELQLSESEDGKSFDELEAAK